MTRVLDTIVANKREELRSVTFPDRTPRFPPGDADAATRPVKRVLDRLRRQPGEPLRLVTEIKRKSPSAGPLSTVLSPAERAVAYARAGATMISVLCDERFFDGGWAHVGEVRDALDRKGLSVLVLAKEFVVDPETQPFLAQAWGADALLAIVRIVDAGTLATILKAARFFHLEPLVEVANEEEVAIALEAGAKLVGVNARDLDTLEMDATRAARVLAAIPGDCVAVHLSGLKTPEDVRAVAASRADAALVGEALMRLDDPTPLLTAMVAAASEARPGKEPDRPAGPG